MTAVIRLEEYQPCRWFVMCDNDTDIAVQHPVLGLTPVCMRCADVVGMLLEFTDTVIHHLAFRMSDAVPICGQTKTGDGLSLESDKVTCPECRHICELGPREEETES